MSGLVWVAVVWSDKTGFAGIAQLVEHDLAKVGVGSSSLLFRSNLARWQSGHADDCNSSYAGSIPTRASIFLPLLFGVLPARVVKPVDTRDLKSLGGNPVPVQVRPRAPIKTASVRPAAVTFWQALFSQQSRLPSRQHVR